MKKNHDVDLISSKINDYQEKSKSERLIYRLTILKFK